MSNAFPKSNGKPVAFIQKQHAFFISIALLNSGGHTTFHLTG